MTTQVTLQVPDQVYRHATWVAQLTQQDVAGVLTDTLEMALAAGPSAEELRPVDALREKGK